MENCWNRVRQPANPCSGSAIAGIIIEVGKMRKNLLVFTVFAAAIFFAVVREWSAPVACIRPVMGLERAQTR